MSVEIFGRLYSIDTKQLIFYCKIPESISKLVNLEELYLGSTQLIVFPESIIKLVKLRVLELRNNQLTVIPESIGRLVNLQSLYLDGNQLTVLPESIGKLVNLTDLSLTNNCLTLLPKSILNIKYSLQINISAYQIDNLSVDTEFLIFSKLDEELTNLPTGLKEIWIKKQFWIKNKELNHKLPFGCVEKYF
jgi:Leucine-rich repeat (LRR) protein